MGGTVEIDPWLPAALRTQMWLAYNTSLKYVMLPATHNSLISRAYQYGLEDYAISELLTYFHLPNATVLQNQQISLTDQLNIGIRMLEFDTSYSHTTGNFRTCDARSSNVIDSIIASLLGVHVEPGCHEHDQPFSNQLTEFQSFVNGTKSEIFVVMLDTPDPENHTSMLADQIVSKMGEYMFTPLDYLENNFTDLPSPYQLARLGKRVVFTSAQEFPPPANQSIFYKYGPYWANWSEYPPKEFKFSDNTYHLLHFQTLSHWEVALLTINRFLTLAISLVLL